MVKRVIGDNTTDAECTRCRKPLDILISRRWIFIDSLETKVGHFRPCRCSHSSLQSCDFNFFLWTITISVSMWPFKNPWAKCLWLLSAWWLWYMPAFECWPFRQSLLSMYSNFMIQENESPAPAAPQMLNCGGAWGSMNSTFASHQCFSSCVKLLLSHFWKFCITLLYNHIFIICSNIYIIIIEQKQQW